VKLPTNLTEEIIMNLSVKSANRVALAFSTAVLVACAVVSSAFADEEVRSETVKFQDLNVNTAAGVEALYQRIHSAAKRVCSESDPLQQIAAGACARKAEVRAIDKVNLPQLTAYYRMKTGDQTQPLAAKR
jgi:UrcA family protein